jgi:hypothetical protein
MWSRRLAGLLALAVACTVSAPPVAAADAPAGPGRSGLAAATAAKLATLKPATKAFAQTQAAPETTSAPDHRPFFKTPTGVAAIILMVAGAGYVAYRIPKDNEKVHSPIR